MDQLGHICCGRCLVRIRRASARVRVRRAMLRAPSQWISAWRKGRISTYQAAFGGDRDQTYQQYWQKVGMPPFADVVMPTTPEPSDTDADHSSPDQTNTPPPTKKKKKETKD